MLNLQGNIGMRALPNKVDVDHHDSRKMVPMKCLRYVEMIHHLELETKQFADGCQYCSKHLKHVLMDRCRSVRRSLRT